MLDKPLNKTIAKFFRFYDENSWIITDIKKNENFIKADKDICLYYTEIENILRKDLGKKQGRILMENLLDAFCSAEDIELEYTFHFAFLSGLTLGMETKELNADLKDQLNRFKND